MREKGGLRGRMGLLLILILALLVILIRGTKGEKNMFGFMLGEDPEIVLDETFDIQGITDFLVDVGSLNVDVVASNDDQVRVVLESNMPDDFRAELAVERNGSEFKIEQLRRVRIGIFLVIREKLTVHLPRDYDQALALSITSGNLHMRGKRELSRLSLNLTSGNMDCDDLSVPQYEVKTTSGNITLGKLLGSGRLQLTSGNLKVKALQGERIDPAASIQLTPTISAFI